MATESEALLVGTGWLPEPLRTPGRPIVGPVTTNAVDLSSAPQGRETAADGGGPTMEVAASSHEDEATEPDVRAIAAE